MRIISRLSTCIVLIVFVSITSLLLAGALAAQSKPLAVRETDPYWVASYWNNSDLSGTATLSRQEANLDWNWGGGSPDPAINSDFFSARWTRYIYVSAGVYRFTATTDDGMRVFIDDQPVLDEWREQAERTFSVERSLSSGHHLVRVEYFERTGAAMARLYWQRIDGPPPTIHNWRGEYYNNRSLAGDPSLVRDDANLDFQWGANSPAPGVITNDNFSVRWSRPLDLSRGNYRFTITTDDGARLWVNNAKIIDEWREQSVHTYSADIYLPGGVIPIRLEYFEATQDATIRLQWSRLDGGGQPEPTPTPASGPWHGEYFANPYLSGSPRFVRNDGAINFNWGVGSPDSSIPSDNFSVRWTRTMSFGSGVHRFTTETDDGVRLYVDGQLLIDRWVDRSRTRDTVEISLAKGNHTVIMEYYEHSNVAVAKLTITRPRVVTQPVGNIITCVPPQPQNYAWIKLYRLDGNNKWYSISKGIGSIHASGYLKIDGLPIDISRFGDAGEPYKVEMWLDGKVAKSTGDSLAGQPEFRVRPDADNYTPWQCSQ